jgi:hypothetical protein
MTALPVSQLAPPSHGFAGKRRLGKFGAHIATFFEIIGAAIRVSQAVESRRDADTADLRSLGIDRPLPKLW